MYYVYILTNRSNNVLYTGVTNNLLHRTEQHGMGNGSQFTRKYHVHKLIYFESFHDIKAAISREKQIKGWRREKKLALITEKNPNWLDLREAPPSPSSDIQ